MEKNGDGTPLRDLQDLGLSILPELSGLLTPDIATNPGKVLAGVGVAIVGSKLSKFYDEFKARRDRGETRESIEEIQDSLYDLLKFITEAPDEERLTAAKKLFFITIHPDSDEATQQLAFQLTQIVKKLSTNDLLVLKAAFEIFNDQSKGWNAPFVDKNSRLRNHWFKNIARRVGHGVTSLVESSEDNLVSLKLIQPISPDDGTTFRPGGMYRLTDLGESLCEFLSRDS